MVAPGQKTFVAAQQEISEEVLDKTIATTTTRPTLARLKQLLNDSYREIASIRQWEWLFALKTVVPATGDTNPTALAADVEKVVWMAIPNGGGRLTFRTDNQFENMTFGQRFTNYGNSRPQYYIEAPLGTDNVVQVYFFPAADQAYTVQYRYKIRFTDLSTDGSAPLIPPEFQDVWIYWTLAKVYRFLGADYKERFEDCKALAMSRLAEFIKSDVTTVDGAQVSRYLDDEVVLGQYLNLNASLWFGGQ